MSENEIKVLRANIICGMDTYVREVIGNDDITDYWLTYGVPDGSDLDSIMYDVEDEQTFLDWCRVFGLCVKANIDEERGE